MYNAQDWENYLIVIKIKDDPVLPRGKSSDVKLKIIELDRKIGHKSVMYISEFFIDRDDPSDLVYQTINCTEIIIDASDEGDNGMYKFFVTGL